MIQKDNAVKTRAGEELDQNNLEKYLSENIPDFGKITRITQFPGGFSNLTYLIETENKEFVLRRPPFGNYVKSGHDMSREFRVLSLLKNAGYARVPQPYVYESTGDIIGAPFYVMERLNGVILRARDAHNPVLTPDIIQDLCEKLIDNLAHLHNLNIETTGLIALGKPENYVQRQVAGWIKRYEQSQTDDIADMKTIADWMQRFTPRFQSPAFLHNDYKFDNVVWNAERTLDVGRWTLGNGKQKSPTSKVHNPTSIIGVLDWEMSTVGDPLMDLGATLAYWCEKNDAPFTKNFNLTWMDGCLTRGEVISRYAEKTGRDLTDINFYYIFGLFKNAVIMQQIYARWKSGATTDPRFAGLIAGVYELSKKAVNTIITE
jgi:aminoglycoside phosphotransferase (APT) family kinase protein